ncbi:DNA modification methylase [Microbacterium sp.]|uniref:DNA modification methylase n=1 Tax=Microbacterium sp. TaxID=51671 RepID=UPI003A84EA57
MKSRVIASLAVGAALVLGATGCGMIAPQATTIPYSPAEGVSIADSSGPLKVRNALVVANADGSTGNFLAAIVNDTMEPQTLFVGLAGANQRVEVPALSSLSLGFGGTAPIELTNLGSVPGTDVEMTFQSGDGTGVMTSVPVLDGMLPYLAPFVPAV